MLILTTVRPAHSTDPKETVCFNWESGNPAEKHKAGKLIADALWRGFTVLSRRIRERLPQHSEVSTMPSDYFTRGKEEVAAE